MRWHGRMGGRGHVRLGEYSTDAAAVAAVSGDPSTMDEQAADAIDRLPCFASKVEVVCFDSGKEGRVVGVVVDEEVTP